MFFLFFYFSHKLEIPTNPTQHAQTRRSCTSQIFEILHVITNLLNAASYYSTALHGKFKMTKWQQFTCNFCYWKLGIMPQCKCLFVTSMIKWLPDNHSALQVAHSTQHRCAFMQRALKWLDYWKPFCRVKSRQTKLLMYSELHWQQYPVTKDLLLTAIGCSWSNYCLHLSEDHRGKSTYQPSFKSFPVLKKHLLETAAVN